MYKTIERSEYQKKAAMAGKDRLSFSNIQFDCAEVEIKYSQQIEIHLHNRLRS